MRSEQEIRDKIKEIYDLDTDYYEIFTVALEWVLDDEENKK